MSHHHDKSMMNSTTADKLKELAADHVEDRGSEQGGGGGEHVMPESLRGLTPDEIHALTRKTAFMMDIVIMPCLIIMYIFNYLDRNSIAAAKLANLTEDLNLSATQYQTCVSILFVGYSQFFKYSRITECETLCGLKKTDTQFFFLLQFSCKSPPT